MRSLFSLSTLQTAVPVTLAFAVLSLVGFLIFAMRKKRVACWVCAGSLLANVSICYAAINVLEDVYARISRHESFSGRSRFFLLSQYGRPSSTTPYMFKGQRREDWIYEIDILGPRVRVQFGFDNEHVAAAGYVSND
jgi:hypothetical protein